MTAEMISADNTEEPATVVYGRLKEAAHLSSYAFDRTSGWLDTLLSGDEWRTVGPGFDDVNAFLRSIDLSSFNIGDSRPALVRRIRELQPTASVRAIAEAVGEPKSTVQDDLKPTVRDRTPEPEEEPSDLPFQDEPVRDRTPEPGNGSEPEEEPLQDEATDDEQDQEPEPAESVEEASPAVELKPLRRGWHDLGPHRLYCGDSTDGEFVIACEGAAFAFADPPYNAGKADWDEGFEWKHDYLGESAEIVAVTPGIAALAGFLANTEMPYKWSIAAEVTNGMTAGALRFGNWICVTLFAYGSIYRKSKDHVRIPAATGDDQGGSHPSRKPLRLLTHLIELFTTKGDTVIDPFLGSGTTLMAAELTGRRCIGAELDPLHCAEIVARYQKQVGSP